MNIEFVFKDMPVGCFKMGEEPSSEGVFSYMPYRGHGHYAMQEALAKHNQVICSYATVSKVVTFVVVACPEYGRLSLTNFSIRTK